MAQPIEQCSISWVLLRGSAHFSLALAVSFLPTVGSVVAAGVSTHSTQKTRELNSLKLVDKKVHALSPGKPRSVLGLQPLFAAAVHRAYSVQLAQLQQKTPPDRNSMVAEQALQIAKEADLLQAQGTPASLRQAIEKYLEAIA